MKHFTSTQSFFEIIKSGKIRLSSSVKLNDPHEQQLAENIREALIINKESYKKYKELENKCKNDYERLAEKVYLDILGNPNCEAAKEQMYFHKLSEKIKNMEYYDFHISSFTQIEENAAPLHWLNYARNCEGLCIEFNKDFFNEVSDKLSPKYYPELKDVTYETYETYDKSYTDTLRTEFKDELTSLVRDSLFRPNGMNYAQYYLLNERDKDSVSENLFKKIDGLINSLIENIKKKTSVFNKNPSYQYEKEIRLSLSGDHSLGDEVCKKEFSCDGRVIFSYIDIPFVLHKNKEEIEKIQKKASTNIFNDLPNPINKIYIGWNNRMKVQDIKNFLEFHGYNVEHIEIKKSQFKFNKS